MRVIEASNSSVFSQRVPVKIIVIFPQFLYEQHKRRLQGVPLRDHALYSLFSSFSKRPKSMNWLQERSRSYEFFIYVPFLSLWIKRQLYPVYLVFALLIFMLRFKKTSLKGCSCFLFSDRLFLIV
jgi:hypothetical protein